jgi:hypothetical protein
MRGPQTERPESVLRYSSAREIVKWDSGHRSVLRALIDVDAISAPVVRALRCLFYESRELDERQLVREIYCCAKQYTFLDGKFTRLPAWSTADG